MAKLGGSDDRGDISTRSKSFLDVLLGRGHATERAYQPPRKEPQSQPAPTMREERAHEVKFLFVGAAEQNDRRKTRDRAANPRSIQDFVDAALLAISDFIRVVDAFPRAFEPEAAAKLADLRRAVNEINRDYINRINRNRPGDGGNSGGGQNNFGGGNQGSGGGPFDPGPGGESGPDDDDWGKWFATAIRAIAVALRDWAIRILDAMVGRKDVQDVRDVADLWRRFWDDFTIVTLKALLLIIFGRDPGFFPA
ncbi:MAG: hypothetical protein JOZ62_13065 [Acidobacteriaceae bacterium]|nr:hypothetical protein [Acidobacteriaceae bacterium]